MGELLKFDPIARRLAALPARERMDQLLEAKDAKAAVHALDAFALYSLIQDVGVGEALELVHLASAEQSQAFIDFDCWKRDRLDYERLGEWLGTLFQSDDAKMDSLQRGLDPEVVGLYFRKHLQVFFYNDEEDAELIDTLDVPIESSPDGVYALIMPSDPDVAGRVRLALQRLYFADHEYARRLLHAARYEMDSPLLDTAYRVRSGRLQQYGFLPTEEAVGIYAPVDPAAERRRAVAVLDDDEAERITLRVDDSFELPSGVAQELERVAKSSGTFFGRAFSSACDAGGATTSDTLMRQVATLVNTSVMADLGEPGDTEALGWAFRRVHGNLNLGLEYLSRASDEGAAKLLERWPLSRILRAGYSLANSLAQQAKQLIERGNLSLVDELPFSLCDTGEGDLLGGLSAQRPLRSKTYSEGFESLAEIERAAAVIALLAYKELWTFGLRNHRREELAATLFGPPGSITPIEDVGFDALLATHAVVGINEPPGHFKLVDREAIRSLIAEHVSAEGLSDALSTSLQLAVAPAAGGDIEATRRLASLWVHAVERRLVEEYGHLQPSAADQTEFLPNLVLVRRPDEEAP